MKVLHVGLYDRYGGACIAAYRQHVALLRQGVDSRMWVRFKVTDDDKVAAFSPPWALGTRTRRILRRHSLQRERIKAGVREEIFDDRSEHGGVEMRSAPAADVINLQFAWGFTDYPDFFHALPAHHPVVVTMHEMGNFTGGCSYSTGCTQFHNECHHCPKLTRSGPRDFARMGWERRRDAFMRRREGMLHFVADSHWLAGEARKSSLLKEYPISVIHYGLDSEIYRPLDRAFARALFNIPENLPVVAFAAASVDDKRKGVSHLVEALTNMPLRSFLLTWGKSFPPKLGDIPKLHLGSLDNEHLMALAYNAADVFVMPSLEEAFGQTALESIACGTPVVAFDAGGISDTVRHEQTGLLVDVGRSMDLCNAITRVLSDRVLWRRLSEEGRRLATAEFSLERNATRYIDLYQSLLG